MRARPIRVYLDSNVLIAYVADEEGRAGVVQSMLEAYVRSEGPDDSDTHASTSGNLG